MRSDFCYISENTKIYVFKWTRSFGGGYFDLADWQVANPPQKAKIS